MPDFGISCLLLVVGILVLLAFDSRPTTSTAGPLRTVVDCRRRGSPKHPGGTAAIRATGKGTVVQVVQLDGNLGRDGTHGRALCAVADIAQRVVGGGIVVLGIGPNSAPPAVEGDVVGPVQR